jgi:transcriptional regulator with XRE-family HTH domain
MTIKEIAEICGVDEDTILRWSKNVNFPQNVGSLQKLDEIIRQGKTTDLPPETAAAIIRAGGKEALAALLEENARNKDTRRRFKMFPVLRRFSQGLMTGLRRRLRLAKVKPLKTRRKHNIQRYAGSWWKI